jgi:hypothetical protein
MGAGGEVRFLKERGQGVRYSNSVNDVSYSFNYITQPREPKCTFVITINIHPLKTKVMGSLLYIIAVILVIAWAVGFFAYSAGGIIHILLVIALIAIIFRVIQGRSAI